MIDERTRAALARLTENERACLMRRLHHQTAKEMAIDLGISPHAVEKRLKMARTKLGVSSSLEAARLLAANEQYGRTGPQASDLGEAEHAAQEAAVPAPPRSAWRGASPHLLAGVIVMSLVATLLALAPAATPPIPAPSGSAAAMAQPSYLVQLLLRQGDKPIGSPRLVAIPGQPVRATATNANGARYDIALTVEAREGSTYLVKMDVNSSLPNGRSVHVTPAALVKSGEPTSLMTGPADEPLNLTLVVTPTPAPQGTTSIVKTIGEWEAENHIERPPLVKRPAETVRSYLSGSFDGLDRDRSGFIERKEASKTGVAFETNIPKGPPQKLSERPLYADEKTPVAVIGGTAGQAAWIAIHDKDGDGKVTREEYVASNFDSYMARGLPVGWRAGPPPPDMVKAPPETVRLFITESFAIMDRDHSGYIERSEAPTVRMSAEPSEAGAAKGKPVLVRDPGAQAAWLATYDLDGDDRISLKEYMDESFARFMNWGVPANWHGAPKVAAK
jgi:DNA-binding CsgD family transcriptional regulator